jgi:hypothetical protein
MATYVALTTTNPQTGHYKVLATGENKAEVEQQAEQSIAGTDIYAETERKNLLVWPVSKVRRSPAINRTYNEWLETV